MADREATWKLGIERDGNARSEARAFVRDVNAEVDKIKSPKLNLNLSSKELEDFAKQTAAIQLRTAADYERKKVAIAKAANMALVATSNELRDQIGNDHEIINRLAVDLARTAKAEIEKLEKEKQAFMRREAGLARQRDIAAQKQQEAEGRAALQRRLADFKRAKAQEVAEAERAARGGQAAYERSTERGKQAIREFDEAVSTISESAFRVARGLTAIGLIGEENFQVVQDQLLAVQGTFDLFRASMHTVRGLSKAWDQYTTAVKAARTATLALAAAEGVSAAAGAAGAAKGLRGLLARGGTALDVLGKSSIGKLLPVVAAAGVGKLGYDIAAGGGQIRPDSFSGQVLGNRTFTNFAGSIDLAMGNKGTVAAKFAASEKATEALAKKTAEQIRIRAEQEERINALLESRVQLETKAIAQADQHLELILKNKNTRQTIGILADVQAATEARIANLRAAAARATEADGNLRQSLLERAAAQEQRLVDLVKQRARAEEELAAKRTRFAQDALAASRAELDTAKQRLASERQTLDAARQRFGGMDRDAQDRVLAAVKKARAGGRLSQDEIGALSSLGTKEAERIVAQQRRAGVAGDNSYEGMQLEAIATERRNLRALRLKIERDAPNDYDAQGNVVGKLVGARRERQYSSIDERIKTLNQLEDSLRVQVAQDTALRRSLFAGERADVARAGQAKTTLEARVNHQVNVVAKFDASAKEIAEQATKKMIEAMRPFMAQVDQEMARIGREVANLIKVRRQSVPGRRA